MLIGWKNIGDPFRRIKAIFRFIATGFSFKLCIRRVGADKVSFRLCIFYIEAATIIVHGGFWIGPQPLTILQLIVVKIKGNRIRQVCFGYNRLYLCNERVVIIKIKICIYIHLCIWQQPLKADFERLDIFWYQVRVTVFYQSGFILFDRSIFGKATCIYIFYNGCFKRING